MKTASVAADGPKYSHRSLGSAPSHPGVQYLTDWSKSQHVPDEGGCGLSEGSQLSLPVFFHGALAKQLETLLQSVPSIGTPKNELRSFLLGPSLATAYLKT